MKILLCTLLLIAGASAASISSSTVNSVSSTPIKNSKNPEKNHSDSSTAKSGLDDNSVKKCLNDSAALTRARNSGVELLSCMNASNHLAREFFSTIEHHSTIDNKKVAEFCRNLLSSMHNCTQQFEDSLRPCLNESDIRAVQLYDSLAQTALSYVCADGGRSITELTTREDETCLEDKIDNLDSCGINILQEAHQLDKTMLALPRFIQTQHGCRLFHQGASCLRRAFGQCNETDVSNLLIGAINATVTVLPSCPEEPSIKTI